MTRKTSGNSRRCSTLHTVDDVGIVELPLHVGWSGRRVYDVGEEDQRLVLYALLLAEAQREDLERFVHSDSLVGMWPRLRRLLGPHARREWERRLMTPASR